MSWNKRYRTHLFDPYMAYLHVCTQGRYRKVVLSFREYFYSDKRGLHTKTLYSKVFYQRDYKTMRNTIIAAKRVRNVKGPLILGNRFMEFGPRPRRSMRNNTSGTVGVHHAEDNRFIAFWSEEFYEGGPRVKKTASVGYGPLSELTEEEAEEEAKIIRADMVSIHYPSIEELWQMVFDDPELLDISPKKTKQKTNKKIKKAA